MAPDDIRIRVFFGDELTQSIYFRPLCAEDMGLPTLQQTQVYTLAEKAKLVEDAEKPREDAREEDHFSPRNPWEKVQAF